MAENTALRAWLQNEIKLKDTELDKYVEACVELGVEDPEDFQYIDDWKETPWYQQDDYAQLKGLNKLKLKKIETKSQANKDNGAPSTNSGGAGPMSAKEEWRSWDTKDVIAWIATLDGIGDVDAANAYIEENNVTGKVLLDMLESGKNSLSMASKAGKYVIFGKLQEYQEEDKFPTRAQLAKSHKDVAQKGYEFKSSAGDLNAINKKDQVEKVAVTKDGSATRQRLLKFYQVYNPAKLDDEQAIDELLRRYQGREQQLFSDLETKYILSGPKSQYVRKKVDLKPVSKTNVILKTLSRLYHENIRAVEEAFAFPEFHTPLLDEVDFLAKPMVLLVGQYSVGKTSFIRYLVGRDFPGIRVGPEPTTDAFFAVMHGNEERLIPGHTVPMDRTKPFRTLQKFGAGFLNKFHCAEVPAPILESITFIDTPGILSGQKQRLGRNYDFAKVVEWMAYRSDRILLLFDAHKLDISDEFKASIEMLKGHDDKIRCILNKADAVTNQALLRVYGALMWSLGKVFKTPEVLRVYVGSFWDEDYHNDHNAELFDAEATDLIADLRGLPRHCATRKINEFVKRTRQMKVHALIIEHLRKQFGWFGSKDKKQGKLLNNLRAEFKDIAKAENLNLNDFPNPDKFRQLVEKHDISKFPKFKEKWRAQFDRVLTQEIPSLMRELPGSSNENDENGGSGGGGAVANPFAQESVSGATIDGGKKWAVSGVQKAKYDTAFYQLQLNSGKASGQQVMNVMLQSGLQRDTLKKVWDLSDIDQDGNMDHEEFALCQFLIEMANDGVTLPASLPQSFVPPGKRHLVEFN
eukprot:CAMPEP_0202695934 /NCGR_PEP_ID=MMETSP1385-20130828/9359_1 /ASSEMBLY_ACC=CAM_ASM_000861 /TAXON_ID=933848 /ORGANISM="Elphidium margaritaceum" /LENGTH=804 /DNA_ID=CAMNT_0049352019 /DNA_START=48 /DNA_END=2462 /DNA_ORIENTATION=+